MSGFSFDINTLPGTGSGFSLISLEVLSISGFFDSNCFIFSWIFIFISSFLLL